MKGSVFLKQPKRLKNEYFYYDLAAILLGAGLLAYFLIFIRWSAGIPDESLYLTIPQRLLAGDRLLADDWHMPQLSYVYNLLPYWLYVRLTGGTEGIILYFRYLFVFADLGFYAYMYLRLRRYKLTAVVSSFLFCAVLPHTNMSFFYASLSSMLMMALCMILLTDPKEKGRVRLFLCGVLLAMAVLAEPFLLFVYILFAAAALLRLCVAKRKPFLEAYAFILNGRVFIWLTLGAAIVFFAFVGVLSAMGSLQALPEVLPYLVADPLYDSNALIDLSKYGEALSFFGVPQMIFLAVCAQLAFVYSLYKKKNPYVRVLLLAASCIALALVYLHALVLYDKNRSEGFSFMLYHALPVLIFALIPYLLCKNKDPRFFAMWVTGVLFSLFVDLSSAVALARGGRLCQTAGVYFLCQLIRELRAELTAPETEKKKANRREGMRRWLKPAYAAVAVCASSALVWNGVHLAMEGFYKPYEYLYVGEKNPAYAEPLDAGPLRGLKTTAAVKERYEASLRDLDTVKELADGAPVMVIGTQPYMNLYLGLPYASFTGWYTNESGRLLSYWTLYPERRPAYIYVSFYSLGSRYVGRGRKDVDQLLAHVTSYRTVSGKAGYMIEITGEWIL